MAKPRRRDTYRTLSPNEPIPAGKPRRYRTSHGYIALMWNVAPYTWVRVYEHRLVAGLDAPQVHHINGIKDDNRPENLKAVTGLEHGTEHTSWDLAEAADLYQQGWSLPKLAARYDLHTSTILRALRVRGVHIRTIQEALKYRPKKYQNHVGKGKRRITAQRCALCGALYPNFKDGIDKVTCKNCGVVWERDASKAEAEQQVEAF